MGHSMPLEVAERLFTRGNGKNPVQTPRTHLREVSAAEVSAAIRAAEEDILALEQARKEQDRRILFDHVRVWYNGRAWHNHPQHCDVYAYLEEMGYPNARAMEDEISLALRQIVGCA